MAKRKAVSAPRARAGLEAERDRDKPRQDEGVKLAVEALAALDTGDVDGAMMKMYELGEINGENRTIPRAMSILVEKEQRAERSRASKRHSKNSKMQIAAELLAEAEQLGKKKNYGTIGRKIADQLNLPKPIKAETVRGWFKNGNSGEL